MITFCGEKTYLKGKFFSPKLYLWPPFRGHFIEKKRYFWDFFPNSRMQGIYYTQSTLLEERSGIVLGESSTINKSSAPRRSSHRCGIKMLCSYYQIISYHLHGYVCTAWKVGNTTVREGIKRSEKCAKPLLTYLPTYLPPYRTPFRTTDLWPLSHLIRVMRRHELTKEPVGRHDLTKRTCRYTFLHM